MVIVDNGDTDKCMVFHLLYVYFAVVSTLLNFVRMFNRAHEENCKQLELDKKKADREAESEKLKTHDPQKISEHLLHSQIKSLQ